MFFSQQSDILGAVVDVSRDKSWRVRWSLAHRVHDTFSALRGGESGSSSGSVGALSEAAQTSLTNLFNNLLNDGEAEVHLRRIKISSSSPSLSHLHLNGCCDFLNV